jgi:hypothetical protein
MYLPFLVLVVLFLHILCRFERSDNVSPHHVNQLVPVALAYDSIGSIQPSLHKLEISRFPEHLGDVE